MACAGKRQVSSCDPCPNLEANHRVSNGSPARGGGAAFWLGDRNGAERNSHGVADGAGDKGKRLLVAGETGFCLTVEIVDVERFRPQGVGLRFGSHPRKPFLVIGLDLLDPPGFFQLLKQHPAAPRGRRKNLCNAAFGGRATAERWRRVWIYFCQPPVFTAGFHRQAAFGT